MNNLQFPSILIFTFRFLGKLLNTLHENLALFKKDSNFFWMRTFGRLEVIRDWVTRTKSQAIPNSDFFSNQELSNTPSLRLDESLSTICNRLQSDGYYQGLYLSPSSLLSFLDFAHTHPCYGDRQPELAFYIDQKDEFEAKLQRSIKLAGYLDTHESCAAFQLLKRDQILLTIATDYLGHAPQYHRGEIAWSFPCAVNQAEKIAVAQALHCDINDYKTIKFFFYLTNVNVHSGPHQYLRGTHKKRLYWHQLLGQRCASIDDNVLIRSYGAERLETVCGPAGFGFVGDPYSFHKGTTPDYQPRLLLQLEFGINRYKTWHFNSNPA